MVIQGLLYHLMITNYSYGEYKALVRQKKIRPVLLDDKKQKK